MYSIIREDLSVTVHLVVRLGEVNKTSGEDVTHAMSVIMPVVVSSSVLLGIPSGDCSIVPLSVPASISSSVPSIIANTVPTTPPHISPQSLHL